MLNAVVILLVKAIELYMLCVVVCAVLSLLISFKIVNAYQPFVQKTMYALRQICEPALKPLRKLQYRLVGDLGGVDLSPVILLLLLDFAENLLMSLFYTYR